MGAGTEVRACTVRSNNLTGIVSARDCYVVGNTCSDNNKSNAAGGGGIISTTFSRIDSNHCNGNTRYGIANNATGGTAFNIRNTATGNTSGNFNGMPEYSGVKSMVTENDYPWLNFSY